MKKFICVILSVVIAAVVFGGCSRVEAPAPENDVARVDVVDFHTALQQKYIDSPFEDITKFAKGKKSLNEPEPIIISWSEDSVSASYTVNISENADMSDAKAYSVSETKLPVYNLKLDTQYYWTYTSDGEVSEVQSFKTSADGPRNLRIDGVKNVRDLGGWLTESGKRLNQDLIFRCARLNESSAKTPVIEITDDGIKTMRDELGIKSEIDLRKVKEGEIGAISESPLGNGVNYYNCPMVWDGDILLNNKQEVLHVFSILSDRSNYPVIFHCNIGTDRTGMIAFLVGALCGVSEDNLKRDYLFSDFADIGGKRTISDIEGSGYYKAVMKAEGSTLSEKTYNCLADFGVPEEQLNEIISIMTE